MFRFDQNVGACHGQISERRFNLIICNKYFCCLCFYLPGRYSSLPPNPYLTGLSHQPLQQQPSFIDTYSTSSPMMLANAQLSAAGTGGVGQGYPTGNPALQQQQFQQQQQQQQQQRPGQRYIYIKLM